MFNKGMEYEINQERRNRAMVVAERERLANTARSETSGITFPYRSVVIFITLIALSFLMLMGNVQGISAQQFEPGKGNFFHDSELAFTLGTYYYNTNRYEIALEKFTEAIEALPAEILIPGTPYANLYRMLGKTQDALELHEEALASYQRYLELNTLDPDPTIVTLVNYSGSGRLPSVSSKSYSIGSFACRVFCIRFGSFRSANTVH